MRYDSTGKVSLDHIYTQPDPRAYFNALGPLGYRIPQEGKPYFEKFIAEYRAAQGIDDPRILDLGCSYGINAALLKYDTTLDELYERYDENGAAAGADRTALLARDREFSLTRRPDRPLRFTGLDASAEALAYAVDAGFLDDAVHADLEQREPTARQREQLAGTDLMISTGCLGYVTERTLTRVVAAQGGRLPWMAHFVARMVPFARIEAALDALGYRTTRVDGLFKQRRFVSAQEQTHLIESISAAGVDPTGLESEGWLYAELYLCRPA